jgi:putative nucleotidyltransferase with HDIG domain
VAAFFTHGMRTLSLPARLYVICLSTLAFGAAVASALIVFSRPELLIPAFVLTAVVAAFDSYPVVIHGDQTETTISTAVKVSAILLFSPSVVIMGTFVGTAIAELRLERKPIKKLFNVSAMTTIYAVMALVYGTIQGSVHGIIETPVDLFALGALALTDLVLNSLIVSLIVSLADHTSLRYVWSENFKPIIWHDFSMVPLGAFIALLWRLSPWAVLFAAVPLLLVRYSYEMVRTLRRQTLHALMLLARMLDERDEHTHHHCELVAQHAEEIARAMGLAQGEVDIVKRAAYLHDIGKIGMSNEILFKPDTLTPAERELAKRHAVLGAELLSQFPLFEKGATYVRHHHERWDGKGYPDGLAGEEIPLGARILCVSDSFQAMIEDRPYRLALPLHTALTEISVHAGSQFDTRVVRALFRAKGVSTPDGELNLKLAESTESNARPDGATASAQPSARTESSVAVMPSATAPVAGLHGADSNTVSANGAVQPSVRPAGESAPISH